MFNSFVLRCLRFTGILLMGAVVVIGLCNLYQEASTLDPFFRASTPLLCCFFAFCFALYSPRVGVVVCIFALPLLPNFPAQLQAFTGYGRVAQSQYPGFDLIAGLVLGFIGHSLWQRKKGQTALTIPPLVSAVMVYVTFSTVLAIWRNLSQTQTDFNLSALIFNLLHLRSIAWHNDYRALIDWMAFGYASILVSVVVSVLQAEKGRNHLVFMAAIPALMLSTIVAVFQSQRGFGLSETLLSFRVDRLGFVAVGFQPDIHAFGGYMLLGAVGVLGYALSVQHKLARWCLLFGVMPAAWVALTLSKSKASIALGAVLLVMICAIRWSRRSMQWRQVLLAILGTWVLLVAVGSLFNQSMIDALTFVGQQIGVKDWTALNDKLVYRPEIFLAALKMFALFPIFGLGQGQFYHQSANYSLTHAYFLSQQQNGENAHNYFLQTLVETGLLGFLLLSLLILYPLYKAQQRRPLIPAMVGLASIFVGNLYSHSLLVRENFFLTAALVGLMYAWLPRERAILPIVATTRDQDQPSIRRTKLLRAGAIGLILLLALGVKEIIQAPHRFPFTVDTQCYKSRPREKDGWTTGLYETPLPVGSTGVNFDIRGLPPDVSKRPLRITIEILDQRDEPLAARVVEIKTLGELSLGLSLPDQITRLAGQYRARLGTSRCFVPRDMAISSDDRRLGVQVVSEDLLRSHE